jgi:hypothetical protein
MKYGFSHQMAITSTQLTAKVYFDFGFVSHFVLYINVITYNGMFFLFEF